MTATLWVLAAAAYLAGGSGYLRWRSRAFDEQVADDAQFRNLMDRTESAIGSEQFMPTWEASRHQAFGYARRLWALWLGWPIYLARDLLSQR